MFILTYFWRENSNKCKLAMLKMRLFRNFITLWKGLKMQEIVEMHKNKGVYGNRGTKVLIEVPKVL